MTMLKKVFIGVAIAAALVVIVKAAAKKNAAQIIASKRWFNSSGVEDVNLTVAPNGDITTPGSSSWVGRLVDDNTIKWLNISDGRTDVSKAA
jgi:hypothetical protein